MADEEKKDEARYAKEMNDLTKMLARRLDLIGANQNCLVCGHDKWVVHIQPTQRNTAAVTAVAYYDMTTLVGYERTISMHCQRCGFVKQHAVAL